MLVLQSNLWQKVWRHSFIHFLPRSTCRYFIGPKNFIQLVKIASVTVLAFLAGMKTADLKRLKQSTR